MDTFKRGVLAKLNKFEINLKEKFQQILDLETYIKNVNDKTKPIEIDKTEQVSEVESVNVEYNKKESLTCKKCKFETHGKDALSFHMR